MKTIKYILLSILFINNVFGQNLVPNPSFENYTSTYSTITTITQNYRVGSGCSIAPDTLTIQYWTTTSASPDRIIQGTAPCYDNDAAQSGVGYLVAGNAEAIETNLLDTLKPNCLYQFSVFLNLETFGGTANNPSSVSFSFLNPTGNVLTSPTIYWSIWQSYSVPFIASASSTVLEIRNLVNGAGLDIDNISVTFLGCPLPVVWVDVRIKNSTLCWTVYDETYCDYYEVLYSEDGSNWENIATVPCKGSSSQYTYYNMKVVRDGYYRLKQVDYDGNYSLSEIKHYSKIESKEKETYYDLNGNEFKEWDWGRWFRK